MSAFMLACYLNGVVQGAIYFRSVNDCKYYTKYLNNQTYETATGKEVIYKCICKVVPNIDPKKVRVY
tara:strand:- start:14117 stop:14317 length:201 start_codon:yes stop_codon:yes gene_type:complete